MRLAREADRRGAPSEAALGSGRQGAILRPEAMGKGRWAGHQKFSAFAAGRQKSMNFPHFVRRKPLGICHPEGCRPVGRLSGC